MLRRIASARRAASLSTSASSAPARLFLPSTATSATLKPAPLLSPPTCPLRFPAITSSCPKPFAERRAVVMVNLHLLHFQFAAPSGRITPRSGGTMNRTAAIASILFAGITLAPLGSHVIADEPPLFGYTAESSRIEHQWEEKLRAIPSPDKLRAYMQRLSAQDRKSTRLNSS